MPNGPKPTPDEARLLDMVTNTGSPEAAADNLFARLLALEEAVASLEASFASTPEAETLETPASPKETA